jgi:hypothetical protein
MATRRVKRIRRTKKQVHRAHGRKTKHHHKRNHNRITRRHQGGMFSLGKAIFTTKLNEKNGPLYHGIEVYKVNENRYGVGNRPLNAYYDSSNEDDQRYAHKIRHYLDNAQIDYDSSDRIFLNKINFDKFVSQIAFGKPYDPNTFRAAAAAAADDEQPEARSAFDKRCVITSGEVSFLGTRIKWPNHEIPLEITKFGFAQKNKKLMDFLNANVVKFVFFKTEVTVRVITKKNSFEDTYDAIFLSIHFKKNKENYCALAEFKKNDTFNQPGRSYHPNKLLFPHSLLFPNNQPGTNDTTDQANVATCYIGRCSALPTGIPYEDFMNVIEQFSKYKNGGCNVDIAREFYRDDLNVPDVLALFGGIPSSPVMDALAGRMSEVTPMGGPSSSSSDL